jgi:hypothetical protein
LKKIAWTMSSTTGVAEGGRVVVTDDGREVVATGALFGGNDSPACDLALCEGEEQLVAPSRASMLTRATTPATFRLTSSGSFLHSCSHRAERLQYSNAWQPRQVPQTTKWRRASHTGADVIAVRRSVPPTSPEGEVIFDHRHKH